MNRQRWKQPRNSLIPLLVWLKQQQKKTIYDHLHLSDLWNGNTWNFFKWTGDYEIDRMAH